MVIDEVLEAAGFVPWIAEDKSKRAGKVARPGCWRQVCWISHLRHP